MSRRWDAGVRWYTDLVAPPTEGTRAVDLAFVRDKHQRVFNDDIEDEWLEHAIIAATSQCEHFTRRALLPQTWAMVLDRFPACEIVLQKPPLLEVVSIVYIDADGAEQTLSAASYRVVKPAGPMCGRGQVEPLYNEQWPSARVQRDAVTVTFRAGYVQVGTSPEVVEIPIGLRHGIATRVAELYKQRSDSVIGFGINMMPAVVGSRQQWHDYAVY